MGMEEETETILQRFSCSSLEEVYMKVCHEPRIATDQHTVTATRSRWSKSFLSSICPWTNNTCSGKKSNDHFKKSEFKELRLRRNPVKGIIVKNLLFLLRFPG